MVDATVDGLGGDRRILLSNGGSAFVDAEDLARVRRRTWRRHMNPSGVAYAVASLNGERVFLGRFIMDAPEDAEIDYRDGAPMNCRRSNLRLCTRAEAVRNRHKAWGSSAYKGVSWHRQARRWRATIRRDGKVTYLGLFPTQEEAAHAYDAAARESFGEFACLNFPRPGEQGVSGLADPASGADAATCS